MIVSRKYETAVESFTRFVMTDLVSRPCRKIMQARRDTKSKFPPVDIEAGLSPCMDTTEAERQSGFDAIRLEPLCS